ncbi:zinc-dependent alcohol dehydrogenase [Agathobaculum massiliense]|uniref:zinc-dependent alcohol dehydrogenase n=1 Tax=Agathobaculum massiliense TaxID=3014267 RepID=UPI000D1F6754|nr:zinc-binding dehydrogenase [Agathobaculum massiliense]
MRQGIVHKIPDSLDFDKAALCEPFAVALHGLLDHTALTAADRVLVMGPGAIGQLVAQAARSCGAKTVLVGLPQDQERLDAARRAGIDVTLTRLTDEAMQELTGGRGFDVAVDCTGAEPAIRQAMKAVKKAGTFIQLGLTKPELTIDYSLLTAKELQIVGTFGHQYHNWEMAIELMASGKVQVDHLITSRYDLEDWQRGFEEMQGSKGIKILLYPNGEQGVEP